MWWKVYFWITVILLGGTGISLYGGYPIWKLGDWVDIALLIASFIGLFSFAYKKVLFTLQFWKVVFVANMVSLVEAFLFFTPLKGTYFLPRYDTAIYSDPSTGYYILIGTLIFVPFYYALYQLAYPQKPSKKKK